MNEHGLGRVQQFDPRSRNYSIRAYLDTRTPRSYTWSCPVTLNQGSEGACVGFSWAQELAARPALVSGMTDEYARHIYHEAKKIDPWPGEDYEGTSILAGVKIVQSRGYITEYRWAFGIEDLAIGVSRAGPAVVGVDWYDGMFTPDSNGFIHPTGNIAGGHAILVKGYNVRARRFLLHNSWGPNWGRKGTCFISYDDLGNLLASGGEACIPVKRVRTP